MKSNIDHKEIARQRRIFAGAIPVGSKITSASLDAELEAGTYECTAMFHSLDPDTGAVLGSAGAVITITIQT